MTSLLKFPDKKYNVIYTDPPSILKQEVQRVMVEINPVL